LQLINSADEFIRLRTSDIIAEYVRAAQDSAPLVVWNDLVQHHPDMRFWVAQNKTVPISVLEQLAFDEDLAVRCMVARKRKLPADLMWKIADDPDETVRNALAVNKSIPWALLEHLAGDSCPLVRDTANERIRRNPPALA
jgi:hypothetical protein